LAWQVVGSRQQVEGGATAHQQSRQGKAAAEQVAAEGKGKAVEGQVQRNAEQAVAGGIGLASGMAVGGTGGGRREAGGGRREAGGGGGRDGTGQWQAAGGR
jgi:hypothetical protein